MFLYVQEFKDFVVVDSAKCVLCRCSRCLLLQFCKVFVVVVDSAKCGLCKVFVVVSAEYPLRSAQEHKVLVIVVVSAKCRLHKVFIVVVCTKCGLHRRAICLLFLLL